MSSAQPAFKLIKTRRLIDGRTDKPIDNGAVLIQGTKIQQVGPARRVVIPEGASVEEYNYPSGTLLPGLIDVHTHWNYMGDGSPTDEVMKIDDDILLIRSVVNAPKHLEAGVTTARDCGSKHRTSLSLREGAKQGLVKAPRLLLCVNPITMTGGHMWQMGGEADGVEGVRLAVRQMIKAGADWIKATATGGRTGTSDINRASYRVDELRALVDEAHRFGRRVGTHCVNTAGIISSLEAGVDTIIHGSMNEADGSYKFRPEVAERIARDGRSVNITNHVVRSKVWSLQAKIEAEKEKGVSVNPALITELDALQRSLEDRYDFTIRYHKLGIPLIPGSDAGFNFFRFGQFHYELECMVVAGLSPMKAIHAVTRMAAEAAGLSETIGTLERGKEADLLVVDGNPAQHILDLGKVLAVFLGGTKVK